MTNKKNNCKTSIDAMNQVMAQLMDQRSNATANLAIAQTAGNQKLFAYWQNQMRVVNNYIAMLQKKLSAAKANCGKGRYSSYDPTPDDMAGIYGQCGTLYPDDQGQYDDCVAGAVSALQSGGSASGDNPNPTDPSTGGSGVLNTVNDVWSWLKTNVGTITGSIKKPGGSNPSADTPKLILGMTPIVAIPVFLVGGSLLVWGFITLLKPSK